MSKIADIPVDRWSPGPPRGNGSSFWAFWRMLSLVGATTFFGFVVGVNWHRVEELTNRFDTRVAADDKLHDEFAAKYATKDNVDEHFRSVQRQLDDVMRLLTAEAREARKR